jgi:taurine dioxygenase
MQIKPITGIFGAEIKGADIRKPSDLDAIKAAFAKYSVIRLRGSNMTPDDHITLANHFGTINVNRFFKPLESHPNIAIVLKEPQQKSAIGEMWHTDHSYDQIPAMGSILHAIETPPVGGDTVFTSMAAAYAALSDPIKTFLAGLYAIHSSRHVFGETIVNTEAAETGRIGNAKAATQDARHPVVIRHPMSGQPCLFVNPQFTTHIEGLADNESAAILSMLYAHSNKPEFQCRISWQAGDVTLWDNRATWHKAINDYDGHRRYMHRITVEGCALEPASS